MIRYECKCCGYDFSEEEGLELQHKHPKFYDGVTCPNCAAEYDEDEKYVEKYND